MNITKQRKLKQHFNTHGKDLRNYLKRVSKAVENCKSSVDKYLNSDEFKK